MLNPRDLDVLNILWQNTEPMMATDIVNEGEGLTQSTVTSVLRKMLNKGLVEVAGIKHSGKVLSRSYLPTEKSKEVVLQNFIDSYKSFSSIISTDELINAIKESK